MTDALREALVRLASDVGPVQPDLVAITRRGRHRRTTRYLAAGVASIAVAAAIVLPLVSLSGLGGSPVARAPGGTQVAASELARWLGSRPLAGSGGACVRRLEIEDTVFCADRLDRVGEDPSETRFIEELLRERTVTIGDRLAVSCAGGTTLAGSPAVALADGVVRYRVEQAPPGVTARFSSAAPGTTSEIPSGDEDGAIALPLGVAWVTCMATGDPSVGGSQPFLVIDPNVSAFDATSTFTVQDFVDGTAPLGDALVTALGLTLQDGRANCAYFVEVQGPAGYCYEGVPGGPMDLWAIGLGLRGHRITQAEVETQRDALRQGEQGLP